MHVHVQTPDGEVKIWLVPIIEVEYSYNVRQKVLIEILEIVREKEDDFKERWKRHFGL